MRKIKIDSDLLKVCPTMQLGCIQYSVDVEKGSPELWGEINKQAAIIAESLSMEDINKLKNIEDSRKLYKAIGKDPYRYRISSEALIRRILQGKGLYKINNVVDANNLISIMSKFSVGSYDVDKLGYDLRFRIGRKDESYKGIGKETINTEYLPVFADELGAYGSPTSDSERAMITNNTKRVLTVLIAFSDQANLEEHLKDATEILSKYVGARDISTNISKAQKERDDEER